MSHPDVARLCARLLEALESERCAAHDQLQRLIGAVRALQDESRDPRLQRLGLGLHDLAERGARLQEVLRHDHVARLAAAADELASAARDGRRAGVLRALLESEAAAPSHLAERLLDSLLEATGAERGFVLVHHPLSTEAEVIAARAFASRNLSVEEYDFSRSLVRRVLASGSPLRLEDAAASPPYADETTVRRLGLRSVLVVPLGVPGGVAGVIYLEDNRAPGAFAEHDAEIVAEACGLAVARLRRQHALPRLAAGEQRVFIDASRALAEIVGGTPAMVELRDLVRRLADAPATVLIAGESGTGKELVARALHYEGVRRDRPFVAINCAAIPESLIESELFGHERGAFTGAGERHLGRLEQAAGGTVLLDEISELPYAQQAKLLRFLQSSEFQRLGGRDTLTVDVRVVAATSRDLEQMIASGRFQPALYYRLAVVPVRVPPLRERRADIAELADHFRRKFCALYERSVEFAPEVLEFLARQPWPGNARELENLVHRLVVLAESPRLHLGDLPRELLGEGVRVALGADPLLRAVEAPPQSFAELRRLRGALRDRLALEERRIAEQALREEAGNFTRAAERLGIHRVTLHKLLR